MRSLKNALKHLAQILFERLQGWGIILLPYHFYTQIPNISDLKKDPYWKKPNSLFGINGADPAEQLRFAQDCVDEKLAAELPAMYIYEKAIQENGEDAGYGPIEADFLYCFVRRHQPRKVVQVGCGVSSSLILQAAKDAGYAVDLVCVEPYPMPFLINADREGRLRLIQEKAQKVDMEVFTSLQPGDMLFIDSTHTVKVGSEVNRIILEVLPRVPAGVFVHFHDIYFPYDYRRDTLTGDIFFWSETTLLYAFLLNNPKYTIRTAMSILHYEYPAALKSMFPGYDPQSNSDGLAGNTGKHFPCSIFLQTLA